MKIETDDSLLEACLDSLQELIRIPSIKSEPSPAAPFGEPIGRALRFFLEKAKELGFQTRNLDGYVGIVEMGEGEEQLGILVHIDVVPPGDIHKWRFAPFSGLIEDGSIWGRGTLDDKGPAMAVLYAMKLLQDLSVSWNKRVRLIIGTDEESSWEDIAYYKQYEQPPTFAFTPDGCFPVTNSEKGIVTIRYQKTIESPSIVSSVQAGEKHNMTPGVAIARLRVNKEELGDRYDGTNPSIQFSLDTKGNSIIKAMGKDGPSSLPVSEENAVHVLLKEMKEILPDADGFLEAVYFYEAFLEDTRGSGHRCNLSDEVSGELTLATCVLEWDGSHVEFIGNIRYPSTFKIEELASRWEARLNASSFDWEVIDHKEAINIPVDSWFIQKLLAIYNNYFGYNDLPQSISGGTYARAFPNTVAFGALIPGKPLNAHEVDEHVELDVIRDWINIYARTIYSLAAR